MLTTVSHLILEMNLIGHMPQEVELQLELKQQEEFIELQFDISDAPWEIKYPFTLVSKHVFILVANCRLHQIQGMCA